MFDRILVCLDGSPLAEKILPLARAIASGKGAKVILLRVVGDSKELSAEESYMRQRAGLFRVPFRFIIARDPATAIVEELEKNPRAIAALTTHGRTAWGEALLGRVALQVIRGARRPVLLYRPRPECSAAPTDCPSWMLLSPMSSAISKRLSPRVFATVD